jgi:hypothetical protein
MGCELCELGEHVTWIVGDESQERQDPHQLVGIVHSQTAGQPVEAMPVCGAWLWPFTDRKPVRLDLSRRREKIVTGHTDGVPLFQPVGLHTKASRGCTIARAGDHRLGRPKESQSVILQERAAKSLHAPQRTPVEGMDLTAVWLQPGVFDLGIESSEIDAENNHAGPRKYMLCLRADWM